MPARSRRVRASIRQLTEGLSADFAPTRSWAHLRWQHLTLWPLSHSEVFRIQRRGIDATWAGRARGQPVLVNGWRVVTFLDGARELVLEVLDAQRAGRSQRLLLREVGEAQS